jgi:hypothetical protein
LTERCNLRLSAAWGWRSGDLSSRVRCDCGPEQCETPIHPASQPGGAYQGHCVDVRGTAGAQFSEGMVS